MHGTILEAAAMFQVAELHSGIIATSSCVAVGQITLFFCLNQGAVYLVIGFSLGCMGDPEVAIILLPPLMP